MCRYALREYRALAQRLAHPALLPWAQRVCELLSANRFRVSRWLDGLSPDELAREIAIPIAR